MFPWLMPGNVVWCFASAVAHTKHPDATQVVVHEACVRDTPGGAVPTSVADTCVEAAGGMTLFGCGSITRVCCGACIWNTGCLSTYSWCVGRQCVGVLIEPLGAQVAYLALLSRILRIVRALVLRQRTVESMCAHRATCPWKCQVACLRNTMLDYVLLHMGSRGGRAGHPRRRVINGDEEVSSHTMP